MIIILLDFNRFVVFFLVVCIVDLFLMIRFNVKTFQIDFFIYIRGESWTRARKFLKVKNPLIFRRFKDWWGGERKTLQGVEFLEKPKVKPIGNKLNSLQLFPLTSSVILLWCISEFLFWYFVCAVIMRYWRHEGRWFLCCMYMYVDM